jgi:hypothetical protein
MSARGSVLSRQAGIPAANRLVRWHRELADGGLPPAGEWEACGRLPPAGGWTGGGGLPSTAGRRARRRTRARAHARTVLLAAVLLCLGLPAAASAAPVATLTAAFVPEQTGGRSTLNFGFSFSAPSGQVPPPLTQIELRYPSNLGIALSGLGLTTCTAQVLEASGPSDCPANSVMGRGTALTGIVLGETIVSESAPITVLRSPDEQGHLSVLFAAEGTTPVDTRIIFPGLLLPAPAPFGGLVSIGVPLVPTLPGAPYISVIHLHATLGPIGVTYYEQVGGRTLAYQPKGILLPSHCPRSGFPFAARFSFLDGSVASAQTAVRCPPRGR